MRIITWTVRILLFVLVLGFVLRNPDPVTVRYFLGIEWQAPLALVVFAFFFVGALLGLMAGALGRRSRRAAKERIKPAAHGLPPT